MRYVPLPVIEGFTLGIAVIIGLQQVPAALGVSSHGNKVVASTVRAVQAWCASPTWAAPSIAVGVIAAMWLGARLRPGFPVSLLAVAAATAVVQLCGLDVKTIGALPHGFPSPTLPAVDVSGLPDLLLPALAVAALAGLESLLSATVADSMSISERHDSDRELFGQGVANVLTPMFGGIPATAAIARPAVNVRAGARSRLAAITQSLVLLLVILLAAHWVAYIPLAALAGVLIATAVRMVEVSSLRAIVRATRGDAAVLIVTALATVAFDLVTAVLLGLAVASVYALRQVAQSVRVDEIPIDLDDHASEEQCLLDEHIVAYRLEGSLFFGAAHSFLLGLSEISDVRVVVLRLSRIAALDATGASVLADTIKRLEGRGITVLLSGVRTEHAGVLDRLGVYDQLAHERHLFDTTPEAIAHARVHAGRIAHEAASTEALPRTIRP